MSYPTINQQTNKATRTIVRKSHSYFIRKNQSRIYIVYMYVLIKYLLLNYIYIVQTLVGQSSSCQTMPYHFSLVVIPYCVFYMSMSNYIMIDAIFPKTENGIDCIRRKWNRIYKYVPLTTYYYKIFVDFAWWGWQSQVGRKVVRKQ